MSLTESFQDKSFVVSDPQARLRDDNDLISFATYKAGDILPPGAKVGDFKVIPRNTVVLVSRIAIVATGSQSKLIFARVTSKDGATDIGWTSTRNFDGKFVNVTLGVISPAAGAGKFGPNAAWSGGAYLGQIDLVSIVDNSLDIERIAASTIEPYSKMIEAARKAGVTVAINSGFRSYPEQKFLWEGFKKGLPGFNKAAKPGFSNHQNGIAFDIDVAGGSGNPTYDWLKSNATSFGFVRTVSGEPWHWEYDEAKAAVAKGKGTFKTPNVTS